MIEVILSHPYLIITAIVKLAAIFGIIPVCRQCLQGIGIGVLAMGCAPWLSVEMLHAGLVLPSAALDRSSLSEYATFVARELLVIAAVSGPLILASELSFSIGRVFDTLRGNQNAEFLSPMNETRKSYFETAISGFVVACFLSNGGGIKVLELMHSSSHWFRSSGESIFTLSTWRTVVGICSLHLRILLSVVMPAFLAALMFELVAATTGKINSRFIFNSEIQILKNLFLIALAFVVLNYSLTPVEQKVSTYFQFLSGAFAP